MDLQLSFLQGIVSIPLEIGKTMVLRLHMQHKMIIKSVAIASR